MDLRLLSIMAVPLPVKGRSLGVLYVDSTLQAKEFTQGDFSLFRTLGGLIALAVENGRLVEERLEKERLARELAVAREIQSGLFPKDLPTMPGFQLAGEGRPCVETSGDYYDVMRPHGVWAVISPFNFPMALSGGPSSGALVAGNCVVLKPSNQGALLGYKLYACYRDGGVPPGAPWRWRD